jgi:hypothetical protein
LPRAAGWCWNCWPPWAGSLRPCPPLGRPGVIKRKPLRLIVVNGGSHSSAGLALSYLLRTCRDWAHIPVLQLGGDDDESEAREATRAGVNFHIGYDTGFEDLLLRLALMMGNEPATRAIVEASPASAFDEALTQVWQAQTDLLHHPHLLPGTLHAAREVLERLLSLRRDEASVEAAMALTRVPRGGRRCANGPTATCPARRRPWTRPSSG